MTEIQNSKRFDLEDRTFNFTKSVIAFVSKLPKRPGYKASKNQYVKFRILILGFV
jgi:hypothetical protein